MEALFILLIVSVAFMFIALYKKDFSLIIFSGIFYFITGTYTMNLGFGNLLKNQSLWLGFTLAFLGLYLILRAALDAIFKKED